MILAEHVEQSLVVEWAVWNHILVMAIPNGAELGGRNRFASYNKLLKEGLLPGAPDLVVGELAVDGKPIAIEMKRVKNGKSSSEQREVHRRLRESGWHVIVAKGADEAIQQLSKLLWKGRR